jgi:putative ABC transport system permease protein
MAADYIVTGGDSINAGVAHRVAGLPGVAAATAVFTGQFDVRGSLQSLGAVTTGGLAQTVKLNIVSGQGDAALARGELLVDTQTAKNQHLHVGSVLPVAFAETGAAKMRVGGVFKYNPLVGSYLTGAAYFLRHFNRPPADAVLVSTAPGTQDFERHLKAALSAYPNLKAKSRGQFVQDEQNSVNQLLGLIYVLLALAVVIALIGIVNTLMLSVFERTHEIGLLRAVGMQRRQVRWMVRSESVIIALFGAVVGIVVGTGLGLALAGALRNSGVTALSVPVGSLIVFLVLAALLGLGAASWPARRAAKLDVLQAIAAQ